MAAEKCNFDSWYKNEGLTRTDTYCHDCGKTFIAEIDFDVDGKHIVVCPYCGHEHCRTIKDGKVTEDRWDGRNGDSKEVRKARTWKHDALQMKTTIACHFIRERWLNFGKEVRDDN